jgi:hypothetical protein
MGQHRSARTTAGGTIRRLRRRTVAAGVGVAMVALAGGIALAATDTNSSPSVYTAVSPTVVGQYNMVAGGNKDVPVAGVDGVPSSAISVQLSVTALNESATSSLYLYATGTTQPGSANMRWNASEVVTVPITTAVGTNGSIHLHNTTGTAQIKVSVIGYYSPANAASGAGYAGTANKIELGSETQVASIGVYPGTYEVQARADLNLDGGADSDTVVCQIEDPTQTIVNRTVLTLLSPNGGTPISLMGFVTTSGGDMELVCTAVDSKTEADNVELVAVQLSSASGTVTGSN